MDSEIVCPFRAWKCEGKNTWAACKLCTLSFSWPSRSMSIFFSISSFPSLDAFLPHQSDQKYLPPMTTACKRIKRKCQNRMSTMNWDVKRNCLSLKQLIGSNTMSRTNSLNISYIALSLKCQRWVVVFVSLLFCCCCCELSVLWKLWLQHQ